MLVVLRHAVLSLLLMFSSSWLSAAQSLQDNLLAQELSTYRVLTLFHLLRLEQGDPDVQQRLQVNVRHFQQLQAEQAALIETEPAAHLALELQPVAQRLQALVLSNAQLGVENMGFHALDDLSQSAYDLVQRNRQLQTHLTETPTSMALRQAVLMQQIAAEYVREAASWDAGAAVYDSTQALSEPVDALTKRFSERLVQLQQAPDTHAELQARLGQVRVIWNYIEQPLLNYRERSLPFVVSRYSEQIVNLLIH
ncbi:hypothetical protein DBR00_07560 [Pseudomonas sp. HMWF032]|uniref:hypothetical protein n=1 Tax=unclassified Pseudomonas TaxID=196821 RepID=UPI000D39F727|nr:MULTISPECIES: hypothetical protein [unclassified Pseudomonas]PTS85615.1 hypothetical protein DBR00_07560 [Pseudomonas sp. HMWF032]PTT86359.1 hypothetical protein DBR41_00520 [Pseudomonas sp. HMWF010]WAC43199.1 hypothetical protein OU997_12990 [Pseudomonas sp. SL4(2022)]